MFIVSSYVDYVNAQALIVIENFNCGQLAEYIADYGEFYKKAKHRYEWLCVNETIKEFQG